MAETPKQKQGVPSPHGPKERPNKQITQRHSTAPKMSRPTQKWTQIDSSCLDYTPPINKTRNKDREYMICTIHTHIHIHTYTHTHTYTHIRTHTHTHTHIWIPTDTPRTHIYISTDTCPAPPRTHQRVSG